MLCWVAMVSVLLVPRLTAASSHQRHLLSTVAVSGRDLPSDTARPGEASAQDHPGRRDQTSLRLAKHLPSRRRLDRDKQNPDKEQTKTLQDTGNETADKQDKDSQEKKNTKQKDTDRSKTKQRDGNLSDEPSDQVSGTGIEDSNGDIDLLETDVVGDKSRLDDSQQSSQASDGTDETTDGPDSENNTNIDDQKPSSDPDGGSSDSNGDKSVVSSAPTPSKPEPSPVATLAPTTSKAEEAPVLTQAPTATTVKTPIPTPVPTVSPTKAPVERTTSPPSLAPTRAPVTSQPVPSPEEPSHPTEPSNNPDYFDDDTFSISLFPEHVGGSTLAVGAIVIVVLGMIIRRLCCGPGGSVQSGPGYRAAYQGL